MTTIDPNIVDTLLAQGLRERAVDLGDEDRFYQHVLATATVVSQRRWSRSWPAGFGRRTSLVLVAAALVTLLAVAAGVGAFLRSHPTPLVRPAVWSVTGTMVDGHALHTATLLADGTVLIAGDPAGPRMDHAELYDPRSGTWTATASMVRGRHYHTATLLPDGRVLVAGGFGLDARRARLSRPLRPRHPVVDCHREHDPTPASGTRRRCCPMAESWWPGARTLPRRSCTTPAAEPGRQPEAWSGGAIPTRPRCCPMEGSSSRATTLATQSRAPPSCMTLVPGPGSQQGR